jgi:ribosomal protein S18 acetylase RimI-like enzyme
LEVNAISLTSTDLADARILLDACNRHERLDLPLNLEPAGGVPEGSTNQFLFREAGDLVGILTLYGAPEAEACVAVHPEHRRRGIGRALLAAGMEECRGRGLSSLLLVCEDASPSGLGFVKAVGGDYRYSEFRMRLDAAAFPGVTTRSPVRLRAAHSTDLDVLSHIIATSFRKEEDAERRRVARDLASPHHRFYIADADQDSVGSLGIVAEDGRAYIIALGVLPQQRGKGHGRAMLEAAITALLAERQTEVFIEVAAQNRTALSLYRACGFRETAAYGFYRLWIS